MFVAEQYIQCCRESVGMKVLCDGEPLLLEVGAVE